MSGVYTTKPGQLFDYTRRQTDKVEPNDYLEEALRLLREDSDLSDLGLSSGSLNSAIVGEEEPEPLAVPERLKASQLVTMPPLLFETGMVTPQAVLVKSTARALTGVVEMANGMRQQGAGAFWESCESIDRTLREATSSLGSTKDEMLRVVEEAKNSLHRKWQMHQAEFCRLELSQKNLESQLTQNASQQLRGSQLEEIHSKLQQNAVHSDRSSAAMAQAQRLISVFSVLKIYMLLESA